MDKKKINFLVNVAYYGIICAIVILFFKWGLKYVLPFVLAFVINYSVLSLSPYL